MKTIVMTVNGLEVQERELPEMNNNDVLVKIKVASVCGSDYPFLAGKKDLKTWYNQVVGHEGGGEVVKIGSSVTRVKVGDIVGIESHRPNEEWAKNYGDPYREAEAEVIGYRPLKNGFMHQGTWAEYIVVPEIFTNIIPKDLVNKFPLSLWEPFGNVVRIVETIRPYLDENKKVVISGCGYLGIQVMLVLKYYFGLENIFITDVSEARINFVKENISLNAYLPWELPKDDYDTWIEMSGSGKAVEQAFNVLEGNGVLLLFGLPAEKIPIGDTDVSSFIFSLGDEVINGTHVIAAFGRYLEDWQAMPEILRKVSLNFDLSKIYTKMGTLDKLPQMHKDGFFKNMPDDFFKACFDEFSL
jgi:threonine 3-dehydrogenase